MKSLAQNIGAKYALGSLMIVAVLFLATGDNWKNLRAELSDAENLSPKYPILASCSGKDHGIFPVYENILIGKSPFGGDLGLSPSGDSGIAWVPGTALPKPDSEDSGDQPFDYRKTDSVDLWRRQYHETVATIISEFSNESLRQEESAEINCLGEEDHEMFPPTDLLLELAAKLPPWKEESAREKLSIYDTWTVLLEFLRLYECTLTERYFYLYSDVIRERALLAEEEGKELTRHQITVEDADQKRKIQMELDTARLTLERVIALHLDRAKLHAINGEIECLERASKDIRIATALSAETAACLPRIQDAKSPLRDLAEE